MGSFIDYIDLDDPAYGLDPTTDYRITTIELCIKDRDNDWWGYDHVLHVIIQDWRNEMPGEINIHAQLVDMTGWSVPGEDHHWVTIEITDPSIILPREFAIGMHPYWPVPPPFYLALDQSSEPELGWADYINAGGWIPVSPLGYGGTFGIRFEVEELSTTGIAEPTPSRTTSFSNLKSCYP